MIKKFTRGFVLTGLALVASSSTMFATTGIFGTDIGLTSNLINGGGRTFFEADLLGDARHAPVATADVTLPVTLNTTGFNGLNLGTFNPGAGDTLTFIGGEALTFKNGLATDLTGNDVTSATINYEVDGSGFTGFGLAFNENLANPGDQRWASTTGAVNLLSGLSAGPHTLTFFASGTNNSDPPLGIFDSNGGANYTASFTVVPEPATILLVGPTMLAGLFYIRRRRA
jgi:hypothetical protein